MAAVRDCRSGHGVFAALGGEDGGFGASEKVQDSFGDGISQRHPVLAVQPAGRRLGREPGSGGWSEGIWSRRGRPQPRITTDAAGGLHLPWLERRKGSGRIRYVRGRTVEKWPCMGIILELANFLRGHPPEKLRSWGQ